LFKGVSSVDTHTVKARYQIDSGLLLFETQKIFYLCETATNYYPA